jgi:hypothetical protein
MYWRHKGQLLGTSQARTDQLQALIVNYLADKNTRSKEIYQSTTSTTQPSLIIMVTYNLKADADSVWADIQNARTSNWIVSPSWVAYGQFPETALESYALLDRIEW